MRRPWKTASAVSGRCGRRGSPLGRLSGTDNLVEFHTHWYSPTPLVVQGRGAGTDATAAGVLSDIVDWLLRHEQTSVGI